MDRFQAFLTGRKNKAIIDGLLFALSFATAYVIRFEGLPPEEYAHQFLVFLPYLVAVRLLVNWKLGIYRFIWRFVSLSETVTIGKSLSLVTAILLGLRLSYLDAKPPGIQVHLPLSVIALEFLLSLTLSVGARGFWRILYQRPPFPAGNGEDKSRILLIGAGSSGARVAQELASNAELKVVGFLDDDDRKAGAVISGAPVVGPTSSLPAVVRKHRVEQVIICITRPERATVRRLWSLCDGLAVRIKIVPALEDIVHGSVNWVALRDVEVVDLLGRETIEVAGNAAGVASAFTGKRILVTGAAGSIGSELTAQLLALKPLQLILLDKDENGLYELFSQFGAESSRVPVHPVVADLRFPDRLRNVFCRFQPEVIFHAAAHKHVALMEMNPGEAIFNNVIGMRNLLEHSASPGLGRFILISSDKAVKPASIMGASKRICELMVQAKARSTSTRFACVRFGNVMGSRGSVIPLFQRQIARGGPVTVTHAEVQRYFMTLPEAIHLVIRAGALGSKGEIFILDMGDPVPIIDIARDLIELSGLRPEKDIKIEVTHLRPGEKIAEELINPRTESLLPTGYEKIWVVKGRGVDAVGLESKLDALEKASRRESLKEIHSILEELDIGYGTEGNQPRETADAVATGDITKPRPAITNQ